jgi:GT2 family glycosyltransferase|tara:strand:+ start:1035 stop:2054 length:1020 start_codon:yes stop_codon:yes gene_type:complete
MKIKSPSVAIVILSWNDSKNTIECLKSVFKNDYLNFDIVLVDNNSAKYHFNNVLSWCKSQNINTNLINTRKNFYKKKNKNLFISKINEVANFPFAKNLGVARGYNKGFNFVLKKNYDFFVRLDCDFIVPKNYIANLVKTFVKNKSAVAVSPKVYYYIKKKTKIIWWKELKFTKNYLRFHRTGKGGDRRVLDIGQFKGIITSDSICGCCVMFKTSIVKKAIKDYPKRKTVLDEDFFFGPEDMEISHRIKRYGKILVNLDSYAHHKVSQSIFVSGVKPNIYFATIGWLLITKKICNKKDQLITRVFFLLRALLHFMKLFYKKDKDPHIGFLLGLKDYFLKY